MMVSEKKVNYKRYIENDMIDKSVTESEMISWTELTITWKSLGDGNYELYVIWGRSV